MAKRVHGERRAQPRCAWPGERCCRTAWGGSKPGREGAEREAGWAQEKKRALKRGRTGPWVGLPLGLGLSFVLGWVLSPISILKQAKKV